MRFFAVLFEECTLSHNLVLARRFSVAEDHPHAERLSATSRLHLDLTHTKKLLHTFTVL